MKVLITGGSGLVGQKLTKVLTEQSIEVVWLTRNVSSSAPVKTFAWDYAKGIIDPAAMSGVTHIVHLAGAGVFDQTWDETYKTEILDSRVKSARLLHQKAPASLRAFISASAIGWYGAHLPDRIAEEQLPPAKDFLANVTTAWEAQADAFAGDNCRVVKWRIGIVLAKQGGALPKLMAPVRFGLGAPLGSGKQVVSWIHIDDLVQLFYQSLLDTSWEGSYNAVAPEPVSNRDLTHAIARRLKKRIWLPNVPSFMLQLLMGKGRAQALLGSVHVSAKKIVSKGFVFKFNTIDKAIENLID